MSTDGFVADIIESIRAGSLPAAKRGRRTVGCSSKNEADLGLSLPLLIDVRCSADDQADQRDDVSIKDTRNLGIVPANGRREPKE